MQLFNRLYFLLFFLQQINVKKLSTVRHVITLTRLFLKPMTSGKVSTNQRAPSLKMASSVNRRTVSVLFCLILVVSVHCTDTKPKKKKDIRDYNDADMARLLEEWEV